MDYTKQRILFYYHYQMWPTTSTDPAEEIAVRKRGIVKFTYHLELSVGVRETAGSRKSRMK